MDHTPEMKLELTKKGNAVTGKPEEMYMQVLKMVPQINTSV